MSNVFQFRQPTPPDWRLVLDSDQQRRQEAIQAFERAEQARRKLTSLVGFWVCVAAVLALALIAVLVGE